MKHHRPLLSLCNDCYTQHRVRLRTMPILSACMAIPDQTPYDFCLRVYLKSKVYHVQPASLAFLKDVNNMCLPQQQKYASVNGVVPPLNNRRYALNICMPLYSARYFYVTSKLQGHQVIKNITYAANTFWFLDEKSRVISILSVQTAFFTFISKILKHQ